MMTLLTLMVVTNTIFMYTSHPLSMGFMLIIQTVIVAFFSSLFMPSFWYSYILILVFMGGLLVLFIYVSTLASNEQLNTSPPITMVSISLLAAGLMFIGLKPNKMFTLTDNYQNDFSYSWMFSSPLITLSIFLIIYLFIVLVAVVKITKFWGGSLRPS